jgi:hypothetical protein
MAPIRRTLGHEARGLLLFLPPNVGWMAQPEA